MERDGRIPAPRRRSGMHLGVYLGPSHRRTSQAQIEEVVVDGVECGIRGKGGSPRGADLRATIGKPASPLPFKSSAPSSIITPRKAAIKVADVI